MRKYAVILGTPFFSNARPVFKARVILGQLKLEEKVKIYNLFSGICGEGMICGIVINNEIIEKVSQGDNFLVMTEFFKGLEREPYGDCSMRFSGNYIMVSDSCMLHNRFTLELEDNDVSRHLLQNARVNAIFSDVADIFNFTFMSQLSKQTEYPNNKIRVNVELIYQYFFQEGDTVTLVHNETKVSGKIVKVMR